MEWSPTYFFGAMNEVYESTIAEDRGLRDIYVQMAAAQGSKLFKNKEFEEIMVQSAQFWKDYSKILLEKSEKFDKFLNIKCPHCIGEFMLSRLLLNSFFGSARTTYCPVCRKQFVITDT
jgi:hypothetical protein